MDMDILKQAEAALKAAHKRADARQRRKYDKLHQIDIDGLLWEHAGAAAKREHMSTKRWIHFVLTMATFDSELGLPLIPPPV